MTCRRHQHPSAPAPLAAALALVLPLCCGSAAAQNSPWFIGGSHSVTQQDNVLELAIGQNPPPGFEKEDTVSTTSLLAGFDQRFGRQRAYGNVALRDTRYDNNTVFNNRGYSGRAGLDWSTAERISGSVSANASRSLQRFNPFEIGFLGDKNLETVRAVNTRVSVGLVTTWSFELNGGRTEVKNSLDRRDVQSRNFLQDSASLGLQWRPSSITLLGVAVGASRGRYPQFRVTAEGFQADRFRRDDLQLTAAYRPSGASSLDLRLSSGKTRYDLNERRDFSGVTGNASWSWQPTGKLFVQTSFTRDTGQDSYATAVFFLPATADYSRSNRTWRVQADYAATGKITVTTSVMRHSRDLVRTTENPFLPLTARGKDDIDYFNLGVRWSPLRNVQLACDHGQEKRRGVGELVTNLDMRSFGCSAQLLLQ
ncbi:hypothetical protein [Rubrivivax rivuli]|uniref:TIGR03016 family PEP-CTERM system-associated outer membrane protein n=1 Tax=Rubrivivax rivuli TaxID=1862385 RepID=A0A437RC53_9BURK|nr:hypothetical protein [Rubrivivax rivuli]RVU44350.1 hypothetical protein EOE66_16865 [Rubrivivax rivuli]